MLSYIFVLNIKAKCSIIRQITYHKIICVLFVSTHRSLIAHLEISVIINVTDKYNKQYQETLTDELQCCYSRKLIHKENAYFHTAALK